MVRRARPADGPEVAEVYHRAFHETLPHITLVHSEAEVREHFATTVTCAHETWVTTDAQDRVLGFVTLEGGHVDHLYVLPEHTGRGLGQELLDVAKRRRPDGLRLFAFQANVGARRFYERNDFVVLDVDDEGARNEEHEPDVLYEWLP